MGWFLVDRKKIVGFVGNLVKKFYINKNDHNVSIINSLVVNEKYRHYTFLLLRRFFNQKKSQKNHKKICNHKIY